MPLVRRAPGGAPTDDLPPRLGGQGPAGGMDRDPRDPMPHMPEEPGDQNPIGQSGETPRERPQPLPPHIPGQTGGGIEQGGSTPPGPMSPTPMSGQPGGGMMPPPQAPQPFPPLPGTDSGTMINPAGQGPSRRSLFGSQGGLLGGGLGVPGGPNLTASGGIQGLLQMLQQKKPGGFGSF